jgi:hypothetical protein
MTTPLRAALLAGRPQIGTWLTLIRNPEILALMQSAGLDFPASTWSTPP